MDNGGTAGNGRTAGGDPGSVERYRFVWKWERERATLRELLGAADDPFEVLFAFVFAPILIPLWNWVLWPISWFLINLVLTPLAIPLRMARLTKWRVRWRDGAGRRQDLYVRGWAESGQMIVSIAAQLSAGPRAYPQPQHPPRHQPPYPQYPYTPPRLPDDPWAMPGA